MNKMEKKKNNRKVRNNIDDHKNEALTLTIGQQLKQKREQLGITQKEIADRLFLKISVVEKMETQNFEESDPAIFIRGYFRSYAKAMGMDEELVLKSLEKDQLLPISTQKMTSFSKQRYKKKNESRLMLFTWLAILFVLVVAILLWWNANNQNNEDKIQSAIDNNQVLEQTVEQQIQEFDNNLLSNTTDTGIPSEGTIQNQETLPIQSENTNNESLVQDALGNEGEEISDAEKLAPPQLDISEHESQEQDSETSQIQDQATMNNRLVITFADDCWIQVVDTNSVILAEDFKQAGQKIELAGDMPYYLKLGTVKGVSITLGDKAIDLSKYPIGKTVRLTLK